MLDSQAQNAILSTVGSPVADPGIDKQASYVLEGSGGMLPPREKKNLRPQMKCSGHI